ncbi:hypothetical protein [Ancylobacter polymorphus]|uniref:Uncharacterized protein n=1 Tax=Ancylobacter polymorphus TaxID=223390 RepID=A0A9E6ZZG1_9HYPH|nr:hypothetical protein [Ancylobacter polymorphus]UOK73032.1 hypothetical protein K9D25_10185 [Ancylobacter polymorphus]
MTTIFRAAIFVRTDRQAETVLTTEDMAGLSDADLLAAGVACYNDVSAEENADADGICHGVTHERDAVTGEMAESRQVIGSIVIGKWKA